ncbi:hypothetical protein P9112_002160 [Eukaryota sp. TZLM1-RC]
MSSFLVFVATERNEEGQVQSLAWSLWDTETQRTKKFWHCLVEDSNSRLYGILSLTLLEALSECQSTLSGFNVLGIVLPQSELLEIVDEIGPSQKLPPSFSNHVYLESVVKEAWPSHDGEQENCFLAVMEQNGLLNDNYGEMPLLDRLHVYCEFLKVSLQQQFSIEVLLSNCLSTPAFINCHQEVQPRPSFKEPDFDNILTLQPPAEKLFKHQVPVRIEDFSTIESDLSIENQQSIAQDFGLFICAEVCFAVPNSSSLVLIAVGKDENILRKSCKYYRGSYPSISKITANSYSSYVSSLKELTDSALPPNKRKKVDDECVNNDLDTSNTETSSLWIAHLFGVPVGTEEQQVLDWLHPLVPQSLLVLPGNVGSNKRPQSLTEVFVLVDTQEAYDSILARDREVWINEKNYIQIRPSTEKEYNRMYSQTQKFLSNNSPPKQLKKSKKAQQPQQQNHPPHPGPLEIQNQFDAAQSVDPRQQPPIHTNVAFQPRPHAPFYDSYGNPIGPPPGFGTQNYHYPPAPRPMFFFKLRGVPFKFFEQEVHSWLVNFGLRLPLENVVIEYNRQGKHSGLAHICVSTEEATQMYRIHGAKMIAGVQKRFIEVIPSCQGDFDGVRSAPNRPMMPQPQYPPNNHFHQGPPPPQYIGNPHYEVKAPPNTPHYASNVPRPHVPTAGPSPNVNGATGNPRNAFSGQI